IGYLTKLDSVARDDDAPKVPGNQEQRRDQKKRNQEEDDKSRRTRLFHVTISSDQERSVGSVVSHDPPVFRLADIGRDPGLSIGGTGLADERVVVHLLLQGAFGGSAQFPADDFLWGGDFSAAQIADPDVFAGQ